MTARIEARPGCLLAACRLDGSAGVGTFVLASHLYVWHGQRAGLIFGPGVPSSSDQAHLPRSLVWPLATLAAASKRVIGRVLCAGLWPTQRA